eukprot:3935530-Pyramimonas_sp.AAC.1
MEPCYITYCRLQSHAYFRLPSGIPNRAHPTTTYEAIGFALLFGLTRVAIGCAVGHLRGGDDARTTGPRWDPAGQ